MFYKHFIPYAFSMPSLLVKTNPGAENPPAMWFGEKGHPFNFNFPPSKASSDFQESV